MMETIVKQLLTTLQLELLKIFAREIEESDLLEIKKILVQFFANKAMDLADKVWEQNGWDEHDEKEFLSVHNRTHYKFNK